MEKRHKNGIMTLDKLARMVANGFDYTNHEMQDFKLEVNDRFNRVEDRLEKVEGRLGNIEENTYELVETDEKINREVIKLKQRVGLLEHKIIRKTA